MARVERPSQYTGADAEEGRRRMVAESYDGADLADKISTSSIYADHRLHLFGYFKEPQFLIVICERQRHMSAGALAHPNPLTSDRLRHGSNIGDVLPVNSFAPKYEQWQYGQHSPWDR